MRSIQVLRGVAACMILAGHAATALPAMGIDSFTSLYLDIFPAGVDIFFVLSGFIICHALAERRPETWRDATGFAARRITRLYPLYWFVLLISTAVNVAMPISPAGFPMAPPLSLALLSTTANWFVPQAWSLSFEAYFYAVVTGLMLVSRRYLFPLMAAWLLVQAIAAMLWSGVEVHTHALILEFGLGCALRAIRSRVPQKLLLASLTLAAVLLLAGAMLAATDRLGSWPRVFTYGLGAACLVQALLLAEARGARFPKALVALGNASYSIYLCHALVILVLARLSQQSGLIDLLQVSLRPLLVLAWIAVALACSLACHHTVERPLLRGSRAMLGLLSRRKSVWRPA